jgi:hypothetical protein
MAVTDGRQRGGNTPMSVLSRLACEIAYVQKRLCLRDEIVAQECLKIAAGSVEDALRYIEDREKCQQN